VAAEKNAKFQDFGVAANFYLGKAVVVARVVILCFTGIKKAQVVKKFAKRDWH